MAYFTCRIFSSYEKLSWNAHILMHEVNASYDLLSLVDLDPFYIIAYKHSLLSTILFPL